MALRAIGAMTDRCVPPPNTPPGTVCVLEHPRPYSAAEVRATWLGSGEWNIAHVGTIILEESELTKFGWRFVRVVGGKDG
jgi:hypothetical protein